MGKAYTRVALVKEKISSFTFETVRGFFQRTLPIAEQDSGWNDGDVPLLSRYVGAYTRLRCHLFLLWQGKVAPVNGCDCNTEKAPDASKYE
jgi:hypothetical protein